MKLYIAEKPSLARAIAAVLPKPHKKAEGYIEVAGGDRVSWCVGHLLELAEPEHYDPAFKKWRPEHLPIRPKKWQNTEKKGTKKQLGILKKLIKSADQLVHAGDPDREGQLLVDEVLHYSGINQQKKNQVQRCLISDLNPPAVKKALNKLQPNQNFVPLSTAALARSRADWLYGINMTRALTLQGQKVGYQGVLSVGRVQTPLLGLVVQRDEDIANFTSKPFYEVEALLQTPPSSSQSKVSFKARWQPGEACQPWQDEEGRVLHKALAENVISRIVGQPGLVENYQQADKKQAAPLPYNLSALQIDAAKRFGMSAEQCLKICQKLYEEYKLITYPRSDCRYLPTDQYKQADKLLNTVANNAHELKAITDEADTAIKSRCWNNSKVTAHHAIIPTDKQKPLSSLGQQEQKVYLLIARQYIAQFYPAHEYQARKITAKVAGGLFIASGKQALKPGWHKVLKPDKEPDQEKEPALPKVKKGDPLLCQSAELLEKETQPPKAFTDATLLSAMTGIARYVQDKELKKILRDTDGLGTEATRASIIELLFKRGFLQRKGKTINATEAGKGLIASLPAQATSADMTAHWEYQMEKICQKQMSYQQFMQSMENNLCTLIQLTQTNLPSALSGLKASKAPRFTRKRKKSRS